MSNRRRLELDITKAEEMAKEYGVTRCGICGMKLVEIRGRYPNDAKRMVCPDCLQCRLDQIRDIADKNYGVCSQAKGI